MRAVALLGSGEQRWPGASSTGRSWFSPETKATHEKRELQQLQLFSLLLCFFCRSSMLKNLQPDPFHLEQP